jgi:hypothetical protein
MSPFEIKAMFNPGTFKRCWTEDLASSLRSKQGSSGIIAEGLHNDDPFTLILGITDNWENDEPPSTSGAKLYMRDPNANAPSRNYALGRIAALLNEEDFDQAPYLEVFLWEEVAEVGHGGQLQRRHAAEVGGTCRDWVGCSMVISTYGSANPVLAGSVPVLFAQGHPCGQPRTEHLAGRLFSGGADRRFPGYGAGARR